MTIYLDVLFMVNFLMDSVWIGLTFFVTRRCIRLGKVAVYASGMALYGCGMMIPAIKWLYSWPVQILGVLGFTALLFKSRGIYTYLKDLTAFSLTSFLLVGTVYGLANLWFSQEQTAILMRGGYVYLDIRMPVLLLGTGIAYALLWGLKKLYIHNFSKEKILLTLLITMEEHTEKFVVLLDTGCSAAEPLTGRPMLVLGRSGERFLPGCHLEIPYTYAGGIGRMKGFYPETAEVTAGGYMLCEKICVGIGEADFGDLPYQGVLNPDAVRECIDGKGERKREKGQVSV